MKKIRTQLLTAFLASAVFLVAVSLYVNFFVGRLSSAIYETTLLKRATDDIAIHSLSIVNVLTLLLLETDLEKLPAIKAEYEYYMDHFHHAIGTLENSKKFEKYIVAIDKQHRNFMVETKKLAEAFNNRFEKENTLKNITNIQKAAEIREKINNSKLEEQYYLYKIKNIFVEINTNTAHVAKDIDDSLNELLKESDRQRSVSFIVIFLSFVFGGAVVFVISKKIVGSVEGMVLVVKKAAAGDFSQRVNIKSKDEIGYLSQVFNQMLDFIQKSLDEIKKKDEQLNKINLELDKKVTERTAELEELKNNLEKTVEERTKQLQKKVDELERFQELTVGRELKMIELKKEMEKLK